MEIIFMPCVVFVVVINASIIVKIFKWQFEYKRDFHLFFSFSLITRSGQQTRKTALNCWFTVSYISALSSLTFILLMLHISFDDGDFTLITFIAQMFHMTGSPRKMLPMRRAQLIHSFIQWTQKSKFFQCKENKSTEKEAKQFLFRTFEWTHCFNPCEALCERSLGLLFYHLVSFGFEMFADLFSSHFCISRKTLLRSLVTSNERKINK